MSSFSTEPEQLLSSIMEDLCLYIPDAPLLNAKSLARLPSIAQIFIHQEEKISELSICMFAEDKESLVIEKASSTKKINKRNKTIKRKIVKI